MIINTTIKSALDSGLKLTNDCITWCQEQQFIYEDNLISEAMLLPVFAFACLIVHYSIVNHHEFISERTGCSEDNLQKICILASEFAMLLLIGFFVWFIYLK